MGARIRAMDRSGHPAAVSRIIWGRSVVADGVARSAAGTVSTCERL